MFHLILLVIGIALTSLLVLVTVNYLPWWNKSADLFEQQTRTALVRLEQAYDVATRAANGTPPAIRPLESDMGFESIFQPVMKLLPGTPANTTWLYGQRPADGTPYANMHYFCLLADEAGADQALWKGVWRAASTFSAQQVFLSDTCGAIASVSVPSSYPAPLALTLYVAYVPGIDK